MFVLLLSTALAQDPASVRGATTFGLFRDGIDFVAQPARLAGAEGLDLWSALGGQGDGIGVQVGAVAGDVGPGTLLVFGRGVRRGSTGFLGTYGAIADSSDAYDLTVDWAMPSGSRLGWAVGATLSVDQGGRAYSTSDPDTIARDVAGSRTVVALVRGGFVVGGGRDLTDVHAELGVAPTGSDRADPDDAGAVTTSTSRSVRFVPAVVVDALRTTGPRTTFRAWLRAQVGATAPHDDLTVATGADGTIATTTTALTRAVGPRATLRLLGHVDLPGVSVRVGGDVTGWAGTTRSTTQVDPADPVPSAVDQGGLSLSVPLAIEARVHPRVVVRGGAQGGWTFSRSRSTSDTAPASIRLDDDAFAQANLGVRWTPIDHLTWDVRLGAGWSGTGSRGAIVASSAAAPSPADDGLDPVVFTPLTTVGPVDLYASTGIVLTFGPLAHGPRTGEPPPPYDASARRRAPGVDP